MRQSKIVEVGEVKVGGGYPIVVQSMLKTQPEKRLASLRQLRRLEEAGCQLVRVAIPNETALQTFSYLKSKARVPLIADIHYSADFAIKAMDQGADKIRINPGTISPSQLKVVLRKAKEKRVPLRVGINAGSLSKKPSNKKSIAFNMLQAAEDFLDLASSVDYYNFIFSLKTSGIEETQEAYRLFASHYDYPLHLGLTEAGPLPDGIVKSVLALAPLLEEHIGDTIRISLTAPPEVEVQAAYALLAALNIYQPKLEIISCPTCGRAHSELSPLISLVRSLEKELSSPKVIAVMGCEVNGPGESVQADLGVTLVPHGAVIFKEGKIKRRVEMNELRDALLEELRVP